MLSFKKVYFAHSIEDYDTDYKEEMYVYLESIYHGSDLCNIIDPSESEITKEYHDKIDNKSTRMGKYLTEMQFYFDKIKKCDDLVAIYNSRTGKFTDGVKKEIAYAQKNSINTYRLESNDKFDIIFTEIKEDCIDGKVLIKALL